MRYIKPFRDDALLSRAAHAARRFQFITNCYRARAASPASMLHEAQPIMDLLWQMGLRPQGDPAPAPLPQPHELQ